MKKMGGTVSRREAYKVPKFGLGAVSGTQRCVGSAGARATARHKSASLIRNTNWKTMMMMTLATRMTVPVLG